MIDPKALSRQMRDTISRSLTDSDTLDNVTVRHLLASHEAADAEITRQSIELTSLRLAMEGVRKAVEDAPHVGCGHQTVSCFEPPDKPCGWGHGGIMCKTHRSDGFPCNCWKSRALALLPAPGEPGKMALCGLVPPEGKS